MEFNRKSKLVLIKEYIREWSSTCTFHCYPKIFQYKSILINVAWSILFVAFSAFTIFLVAKALIDYFQYEVISKIQVVNVDELDFPIITICDSNAFTSKHAESYIDDMLKNFKNYDMSRELFEAYILFHTASLNDTFKRSLGFNIEYKFVECNFNLNKCDGLFEWFYTHMYGNCFHFNPSASLMTSFQGELNGLSLKFSYLVNENVKYSSSYLKGLQVYVQTQANMPSFVDNALLIQTGKQTNMVIRKTVSQNQPKPYTNCDDLKLYEETTSTQSDLFKFIKESGKKYEQKDCFLLCLQNLIMQKCKCFYVGIPVLKDDVKPCGSLQEFACFSNIIDDYKKKIVEYKKNCSLFCPLECDSVSYEFEISSLDLSLRQKFSNDFLMNAEYSNQRIDYEEYKERFLNLNIFFSAMEYKELTQTPKTTVIELIANLGGALGIFLGFSVFSLIEIVEVIARVVCILLGKNDH
jgi:hypothetical protein